MGAPLGIGDWYDGGNGTAGYSFSWEPDEDRTDADTATPTPAVVAISAASSPGISGRAKSPLNGTSAKTGTSTKIIGRDLNGLKANVEAEVNAVVAAAPGAELLLDPTAAQAAARPPTAPCGARRAA